MARTTETPIHPNAQEFVDIIRTFHIPRYVELPAIELYMDQVLSYVEKHLYVLMPKNEKLLTSSMVNNYVKNRIIPMPEKKRYNEVHLAYLIVICILKRCFSMSDIHHLLRAQEATHGTQRSYDFFCTAFEESLRAMFHCEHLSPTLSAWTLEAPDGCSFSLRVSDANTLTQERRLALSAATTAANKIYVEKNFELGILESIVKEATK